MSEMENYFLAFASSAITHMVRIDECSHKAHTHTHTHLARQQKIRAGHFVRLFMLQLGEY